MRGCFRDPLLELKLLSSPSSIIRVLLTQTLCDTEENVTWRSVPELVSPQKKMLGLYLLPASWPEHPATLLECCESSRLFQCRLSLGLVVLGSQRVIFRGLLENGQETCRELEGRPSKALGTSCRGNREEIRLRSLLLEKKTFLYCHHPGSECKFRAATFAKSPESSPIYYCQSSSCYEEGLRTVFRTPFRLKHRGTKKKGHKAEHLQLLSLFWLYFLFPSLGRFSPSASLSVTGLCVCPRVVFLHGSRSPPLRVVEAFQLGEIQVSKHRQTQRMLFSCT